jgi:hypothetical protein
MTPLFKGGLQLLRNNRTNSSTDKAALRNPSFNTFGDSVLPTMDRYHNSTARWIEKYAMAALLSVEHETNFLQDAD